MAKCIELLVKTGNPAALDLVVQNWAASVGQFSDGSYRPELAKDKEGNLQTVYVVRCLGDAEFVKFAINAQGYGMVIDQRAV